MKIFNLFKETQHKELNILRKVIIILGFLSFLLSFANGLFGGFLGAAMIVCYFILYLLMDSIGGTGFGYLSSNLLSHNLFAVFSLIFLSSGFTLMEIFSIAKMGKKKSKIFSVSMFLISLSFILNAFYMADEIISLIFSLGLSIVFFISGIIHNKHNIKQSTYIIIGTIILLLFLTEGLICWIIDGKSFLSMITEITTFLPILLYMFFYPKDYVMPKYINNSKSDSSSLDNSSAETEIKK